MSKEMREQIDRVKSWKQFVNENKGVDGVKYLPITQAKVNAFTEFDEDKDGNEILVVRIDSIVVPKKLRGMGIGKREFYNILEWAKSKGATMIILESERDAISFWEHLGFDVLDQGSEVSTATLEI
jgi:GNAT superfamily N-acetyltransferase